MVEWFQKITGWDDYTLLWFAFLEGVILTLLVGYFFYGGGGKGFVIHYRTKE